MEGWLEELPRFCTLLAWLPPALRRGFILFITSTIDRFDEFAIGFADPILFVFFLSFLPVPPLSLAFAEGSYGAFT